MNQLGQDAVKRALAEEFGLTHIEDPDELRRLVQAKMSEMNALDRWAFEMRVGRFLREAESGGPPEGRYIFLAYVVFGLIAWFIWRPLVAVLAIFVCSNIRGFAIRNALFWKPSTAVALGGIYGIVIVVLVRVGAALTVHTTTGGIVFGVLGLFATGYISHGVPTQPFHLALGEEKRVLAQVGALVCYLIAVVALFLAPFSGSGR